MRVLVRADHLGNISIIKPATKLPVLVRADCFTGKYYLQACDNDTSSRLHCLFKSKIFLILLTTWCQIQPIIKKTHESWKVFSQSQQSWKEVLAIESALAKKQRCYGTSPRKNPFWRHKIFDDCLKNGFAQINILSLSF
jgi:hypothetical protein